MSANGNGYVDGELVGAATHVEDARARLAEARARVDAVEQDLADSIDRLERALAAVRPPTEAPAPA